MTSTVLDARAQSFVDRLARSAPPSLRRDGWEAVHQHFAALQRGGANGTALAVEDLQWPAGSGGEVALRIVRPIETNGMALPLIVYCPGGMGLTGDRHTHDRLLRLLARRVGAAVALIDYPKVPAARHPVQLELAYAALERLAREGPRLGIDPDRIAVAGDGLGGGIATALALTAKCRRGPGIALQVLFCPVVGEVGIGGTWRRYRDGPWLTRADVAWTLRHHLSDAAARSDPFALPLLASHDLLNDLPEALIIVAEHDPLRDQGEAYARRLVEAEVAVACLRCLATIHDFVVLDTLADSAPARAATTLAVAALRESLGCGPR